MIATTQSIPLHFTRSMATSNRQLNDFPEDANSYRRYRHSYYEHGRERCNADASKKHRRIEYRYCKETEQRYPTR
jgi:hypothetical protein